MRLLIVGASARAAAFSARRAGFQPICVDLFADRDLTAIASALRLPRAVYPEGLATLADTLPPAPWIYTGGLENHPVLIDRIAAARPLWGNDGLALRAVRDPFAVAEVLRRASLPGPRVTLDPDGLPCAETWLVKPFGSAGGQEIARLTRETEPPRQPVYYQERISGRSFSATFLGRRQGADLVGVTRQWIGRPVAPFAYVGSIGPWPLGDALRGRIEVLGHVLGTAFGLVGLFGIDFVLHEGHPWPVEINPRYTASVEVLELALGRVLLSEHRHACDPSSTALNVPEARKRPGVVGKLILFASAHCRFPEDDDWRPPTEEDDPFELPRLGDVPHPGTVFEPGEPVLTLFAAGTSPLSCRARLRRERDAWQERLRHPWS